MCKITTLKRWINTKHVTKQNLGVSLCLQDELQDKLDRLADLCGSDFKEQQRYVDFFASHSQFEKLTINCTNVSRSHSPIISV